MIAVDTGILIWGVRKERPDDRPELVERCEALLDDFKRRKVPIMVPSVAMAQFLMGHSDDRAEQQQIIESNFFVAPFDAKAAAYAAELYDKKTFGQVRKETKIGKQCLMADYKIIATAMAHGAKLLFADDKHFKKFAGGQDKVIIKPIPALGTEPDGQKRLGGM